MAIQWHIVQREASLGLLDSTLKRNRHGAVLVGPAGVGKTMLARNVVERFAQRNAKTTIRWLAGTASALCRNAMISWSWSGNAVRV